MNKPETYRNLHDFLDACFEGREPSALEIKQAKEIYWRAYNSRLKKEQRKKNTTVSISLNKAEISALKQCLDETQTLSGYIKVLVLNQIHSNPQKSFNAKAFSQIDQQLFLLIEYLEQLLFHNKTLDRRSFKTLEKHLEVLEKLFQTLFP